MAEVAAFDVHGEVNGRIEVDQNIAVVLADELNVDRRGLPLVQGAADEPAGIEGEFERSAPGDLPELAAQESDIVLRGVRACGAELDLDERVHRAGVGGIG